jgi:hypothetical protein
MAKKFELLSGSYHEVKAVAGGTLAAGDFVSQQEIDGFTLVDAVATDEIALIVKAEKVKVEKDAGTAWVAGDALYWDAVGENVTTVLTSNTLIGFAYEAADSAAVVGYMTFDGSLAFAKA